MAKVSRMFVSVAVLTLSFAASAQINYVPVNPAGPDASFPPQNPLGPAGIAYQSNYPYEGQCVADPANALLFPLLPACTTVNAPSFACPSGRTAGGWGTCGVDLAGNVADKFTELQPLLVNPAIKYVWEVLNPPDYKPDQTTFPGADYYEIGLHEAWGFDALAKAGAFPNPGVTVPNGKQWTGIVGPNGPLFTPIWGVGQINMGGGPVTSLLTTAGTCQQPPPALSSNTPCSTAPGAPAVCVAPETCVGGLGLFDPGAGASAWSANDYIATWPSISIRATRGRPVVVKWVNEFPNNHVFCPHPEAADWPCAIDRTFMGVKSKIDPALWNGNLAVPAEGVNAFGSPQQPDNSWVTHLHGGEIPPSTDGFAEKWFGNKDSAAAYAGFAKNYVNPPFESPLKHPLSRPVGNSDTYAYPMVQEEALIWFHDHTLGKTHHNVIAGPAGFFPIEEPAEHSDPGTPLASLSNFANDYTCVKNGVPNQPCLYGWLDILTRPRDAIGRPLYDLFLAVQDRSFNADGSIDFSNGLGQAVAPGVPPGFKSVTAGANPMVHPVWVPEYFGDHALVNGVAWPKKTVAAGMYRIRLVDGSDSRCWTIGLSTIQPAPGTPPVNNVPFWVLATDQGYLYPKPTVPLNALGVPEFTMCPGERYELLVDFEKYAGLKIFMTNSAGAPFPFGLTPFDPGSPWPDTNTIMMFDVGAPGAPAPILKCQGNLRTNCVRNPPAVPAMRKPVLASTVVRQVYLNEKVDGVTLAPLGMQLNGVPFEYKVTETPVENSVETWQFINLTVDAHPMHPHLVKHQIVSRQPFDSLGYKALLCGSPTCQPGPSPGNEMQVVPDVTPLLLGLPTPPAPYENGWKDASPAPPDQVTTIVARWEARWPTVARPPPLATGPLAPAPGQTVFLGGAYVKGADAATCRATPSPACEARNWVYEDVTEGPYVWHCHINSHEDSEMMRTSLVVR